MKTEILHKVPTISQHITPTQQYRTSRKTTPNPRTRHHTAQPPKPVEREYVLHTIQLSLLLYLLRAAAATAASINSDPGLGVHSAACLTSEIDTKHKERGENKVRKPTFQTDSKNDFDLRQEILDCTGRTQLSAQRLFQPVSRCEVIGGETSSQLFFFTHGRNKQ